MSLEYSFNAKLWKYPGEGAWYFVTLPRGYAEEIKSITTGLPNKGFGTVKVDATIANMTWATSVFPDKRHGSYLMPIKKDIRSHLSIEDEAELQITITLKNI